MSLTYYYYYYYYYCYCSCSCYCCCCFCCCSCCCSYCCCCCCYCCCCCCWWWKIKVFSANWGTMNSLFLNFFIFSLRRSVIVHNTQRGFTLITQLCFLFDCNQSSLRKRSKYFLGQNFIFVGFIPFIRTWSSSKLVHNYQMHEKQIKPMELSNTVELLSFWGTRTVYLLEVQAFCQRE